MPHMSNLPWLTILILMQVSSMYINSYMKSKPNNSKTLNNSFPQPLTKKW